jgi:hypothetical protein
VWGISNRLLVRDGVFSETPTPPAKKKSYCTLAVTGFLIEMFSAFSLARLHSTYSSDIADKENVTARDSKVPNDCIISTRRFFSWFSLTGWIEITTQNKIRHVGKAQNRMSEYLSYLETDEVPS